MMKHIIDIIRQIPTDIVNHIVERNVIANAANVLDNIYLQYLHQLWKTYFDSTSSSSLDCAYCRQELINNFKNGLLVKNQDTQALVQALNTLFEDKTLYLHCKSNAKLSVRKFDITEIGKQWEHLFRKS